MEFINDFIYFVIKPFDNEKFIYCSGVNITKFLSITKGKHRLGQNPVVKGLQSLNNDIRQIIIEEKGIPETIKNLVCIQTKPVQDDLWYTESFLIHKYNIQIGQRIYLYAPVEFLKKIFRAMLLNETVPESLNPRNMQQYLYNLCDKYSAH